MTTMYSNYTHTMTPQFNGIFNKKPSLSGVINQIERDLKRPIENQLNHPANTDTTVHFIIGSTSYRLETPVVYGTMPTVVRLSDIKNNTTIQVTGSGCFGQPSVALFKSQQRIEDTTDLNVVNKINTLISTIQNRLQAS